MISPLSHLAAAPTAAATVSAGLPWWAWVLMILLVVILLSFVFEKLEGKSHKDSGKQDSPRSFVSDAAKRPVGDRSALSPRSSLQSVKSYPGQLPTHSVGVGQTQAFGSMARPQNPPPTLSHSAFPPTTYGTLAAHNKQQSASIATMPPPERSVSPAPAFHHAATVAPTHSMPVTRHGLTASPQLGTVRPGSFTHIPQTATSSPLQSATFLHQRSMSPPRVRSPTAGSIGSGIGTPVHGATMQPSFSHHALHSYPNYGQAQGRATSPPGTWPHNPAVSLPVGVVHRSVSYDSDGKNH